MVYVLNCKGQPVMPTSNYAKVRILLKTNKAKVVKRCPFTIQLMYNITNYIQKINLGVDAGSKHIGVSATTKDRVLYEADVELRNDIVDLLSTRKQNRRRRRNRKTRYRQPRFNNRISTKKEGWLSPSIKHKVDAHLTIVEKAHQILPINKIIIETASFDIQKIKNPSINGNDYQQGEQFGFGNVREYVLFRDNHICQCCYGKSKDKILHVHHIESRKTGGNSPNNLITLCKSCHSRYHNGMMDLPVSIYRGMSFRHMSFMGIMRWTCYTKLKSLYSNVVMSYGYITKNLRIKYNLPKEHYIDARCISGNPLAISNGIYYYQKKVRCHNRQIHKNTIYKNGYRKLNQAPYRVYGYRLFDKVSFHGQECFIFGRRRDGRFAIRLLDGTKINEQVLYKKLRFIESAKYYITERRTSLIIGNNSDVFAAI